MDNMVFVFLSTLCEKLCGSLREKGKRLHAKHTKKNYAKITKKTCDGLTRAFSVGIGINYLF